MENSESNREPTDYFVLCKFLRCMGATARSRKDLSLVASAHFSLFFLCTRNSGMTECNVSIIFVAFFLGGGGGRYDLKQQADGLIS